jgi:hypothetical protein
MTEQEHIKFLKDQLFTLRLQLVDISSKASAEAIYSDEEKRKAFRKLEDLATNAIDEIDKAREQVKTYS